MPGSTKNHYELLGVPRDAPIQVIRDSYKELARIFHPDSHFFDDILEEAGVVGAASTAPAPSPEADETFKLITEAYNTLSNAARRAEYDAALPRETPDWDTDLKREFELDQLQRRFDNPSATEAPGWGSFGMSGEVSQPKFGTQPTGEFERPAPVRSKEEMAYKSVSEIIRMNNSFAGRLRRLFGI
jgi:curved DNA-binding protein CbpA